MSKKVKFYSDKTIEEKILWNLESIEESLSSIASSLATKVALDNELGKRLFTDKESIEVNVTIPEEEGDN